MALFLITIRPPQYRVNPSNLDLCLALSNSRTEVLEILFRSISRLITGMRMRKSFHMELFESCHKASVLLDIALVAGNLTESLPSAFSLLQQRWRITSN